MLLVCDDHCCQLQMIKQRNIATNNVGNNRFDVRSICGAASMSQTTGDVEAMLVVSTGERPPSTPTDRLKPPTGVTAVQRHAGNLIRPRGTGRGLEVIFCYWNRYTARPVFDIYWHTVRWSITGLYDDKCFSPRSVFELPSRILDLDRIKL